MVAEVVISTRGHQVLFEFAFYDLQSHSCSVNPFQVSVSSVLSPTVGALLPVKVAVWATNQRDAEHPVCRSAWFLAGARKTLLQRLVELLCQIRCGVLASEGTMAMMGTALVEYYIGVQLLSALYFRVNNSQIIVETLISVLMAEYVRIN